MQFRLALNAYIFQTGLDVSVIFLPKLCPSSGLISMHHSAQLCHRSKRSFFHYFLALLLTVSLHLHLDRPGDS